MNKFLKILLSISFVFSVVGLVLYAVFMILPFFWKEAFDFYNTQLMKNVRMFLAVPVFIVWIYDLIIWNKRDKNIVQLLLLFVLNIIYIPFYYRKAQKKGWIQ
jgi:hypothetical protein